MKWCLGRKFPDHPKKKWFPQKTLNTKPETNKRTKPDPPPPRAKYLEQKPRKKKTPKKGMLIVSHNIEEVVMMADRVLIFASDPGRVRAELPITLNHPRVVEGQEVHTLIDNVYGLMTAGSVRSGRLAEVEIKLQLGDRLPEADIARMDGILLLLPSVPFHVRAALPKLAAATELTDME